MTPQNPNNEQPMLLLPAPQEKRRKNGWRQPERDPQIGSIHVPGKTLPGPGRPSRPSELHHEGESMVWQGWVRKGPSRQPCAGRGGSGREGHQDGSCRHREDDRADLELPWTASHPRHGGNHLTTT
jgi:hypothetical protein